MNTHERMTRMYEHRDADSIPVTDSPWAATVERWHREGMPVGMSVVTRTTAWGQTVRNWKTHGGVPEFLECKISTPDAWQEAKKRMTPSRNRIIPVMKQSGGFVISSDHSVPDSVSLEQFREFIRLARELGR